jgi:hypothetical protein
MHCGTARRNIGHSWLGGNSFSGGRLGLGRIAQPPRSLFVPSRSHSFCCLNHSNGGLFGSQASERHGGLMSDSFSLLGEVDRICGQIAAAMQTSELQIYATVALIVV